METHRKTDDAGVQKRWMIVTDSEGRIVAERLFRKDWIDYHIAHAIMFEQLELPDPELAKQLRWYSAKEPMRQIYEKILQEDPNQAYVTIDGKKYYGPMSDAMTSGTAPVAPTVKSAQNYKNGNVKITWIKSANASGYVIYCVNSNGYVSEVDTVVGGKKTSYTYNPWSTGKYTYKVAAYRLINGTKYIGEKGKGKSVNIKY